MSAGGIVVVSLTPVVFTEGQGSPGPDELLAPAGRVAVYELPVTGLRGEALGPVVGAWHTPVDNLPALGAFARLDVLPSPRNPAGVQLSASGVPGQQGRIRLRITVLCEASGARRGGY